MFPRLPLAVKVILAINVVEAMKRVKGVGDVVDKAFASLLDGLNQHGASLGPTSVR